MGLSDWDHRVFANAGWQLTNGVKLSKPLPYCEFLFYKAKYYGTNFSATNDLYGHVPETSEIALFPNPSSNRIYISYSLLKNQTIHIRIIEPISGRVYKTLSDDFQADSIFNMPLDISNLPKGIYLIIFQTKDTFISKKFIKI